MRIELKTELATDSFRFPSLQGLLALCLSFLNGSGTGVRGISVRLHRLDAIPWRRIAPSE